MCMYKCIVMRAAVCDFPYIFIQAVRKLGGGGREGSLVSPFWSPKSLYTQYILSPQRFESGPLASMLLRITTVQMSLVAAM